jgi:signal transduction histidine kinase
MAQAHPTSADAGLAGQLAPELRGALAAVSRVARALVGSGSFDELAAEALTQLREALEVELAALYIPVAGASTLRCHATSAAPDAAWRARESVSFDAEAWDFAVRSSAPLVFREQASWLHANPFEPPADAWLVLPLTRAVLVAAARRPIALTASHGIVLSLLSDLLSAGLATARLRQQLQRAELERERMRLAAQVHDGLAQDLALAVREVALLDDEPDAEVAAASRARLREAITDAHARVRKQLREYSTDTPTGGLAPAIEEVCGRVRRRGLPVTLRCDAALPELPPARAAVALRVLSEALVNVEHHAHAGGVVVTLAGDERELTLVVADDGDGMTTDAVAAAAADGHLGVTLMHERARAADGRLELRSEPGAGTTVTLRLPLL